MALCFAVAFGMYDLDKDGYISLDDLTDILQHTTKGHSDPIRVKMIAASLLQVNCPYSHVSQLSHPLLYHAVNLLLIMHSCYNRDQMMQKLRLMKNLTQAVYLHCEVLLLTGI